MKDWAIDQWSRNWCVSGLDRYSETLNRSVTKLVNSWILMQIMESYFKYFVSQKGMAIYYCHFLGVWLHCLASSVGTEAERANLMNKWFCTTKSCCFNVVGLKGCLPVILYKLSYSYGLFWVVLKVMYIFILVNQQRCFIFAIDYVNSM